MEDDEEFAKKLKGIVEELQSDQHVQVFFKDVDVRGGAEISGIEQTAKSGGTVRQEAVIDVRVGGDLKIGHMKQQG